ncbi:unnamed protein product [Nezara viridula]|uniref:Uncharacterized protein n=1 Tax=Nezara viridula TaxID=85310 RepID=A0A9P0MU41_NEZVI|nr:unnamed protein product [Nezara viridula]
MATRSNKEKSTFGREPEGRQLSSISHHQLFQGHHTPADLEDHEHASAGRAPPHRWEQVSSAGVGSSFFDHHPARYKAGQVQPSYVQGSKR